MGRKVAGGRDRRHMRRNIFKWIYKRNKLRKISKLLTMDIFWKGGNRLLVIFIWGLFAFFKSYISVLLGFFQMSMKYIYNKNQLRFKITYSLSVFQQETQ